MLWEQQVQYASLSDIGFRRRNNEDSHAVQICPEQDMWRQRGHFLMVADGMGGHAVGELASKIAADTVPHTFFKTRDQSTPEALRSAIETANATIYERGMQNREFQRMGTTCTALVLSPEGATVGHVGDSRVYRIRSGRIDQLSFDHSLQWELLRQGKLKAEEVFLHEPRHVITRSLGPEEKVSVDIEGPYAVMPGDVYLLCSDGLTGQITDEEIGAVTRELPVREACKLLVNLANLRGGSDNITVVIARVGEIPGDMPPVVESEPDHDPDGLGRWWLAGFWTTTVAFAVGVSMFVMGRYEGGAILASVAVVALAVLIGRWLNTRSSLNVSDDKADTVLWKTYRTASAKLTPEFLNQLAEIESKLQRTAQEEGWELDWPSHEEAYLKAKKALSERRYSAALSELSNAIDVLMVGVHAQRKRIEHDQKWGKPPTPTGVERQSTPER